MTTAEFSFTSLDSFEIKGRGTVYVVENPFDWNSPEDPFIGKLVTIDGEEHLVLGVETYAVVAHRAGTTIGLLVGDRSVTE